jgi:hypothetical protein
VRPKSRSPVRRGRKKEQAHESIYSVCLQANLRTSCRQGAFTGNFAEDSSPLYWCWWRWTSSEEEEKKANQQAAAPRIVTFFITCAITSADGFHLGSTEFCQFRCFHMLGIVFFLTLEERHKEV